MKIGYGYCRNDADLRAAGAEKVYLDGKKTMREDRELMLRELREGDVVLLLRPGDLGAGKGLAAIKQIIADRGCTIEVSEMKDPPRKPGPKPKIAWRADVARMWHDMTVDQHRVFAKAGGSRQQVIRCYGNRSDKPKHPLNEERET